MEFESRLHAMRVDDQTRQQELSKYKLVFDEILAVDETICSKAAELKRSTPSRLPTIDALIAGTAAIHRAILVHRDPHFLSIPTSSLMQEMLPQK